MERALIGENDGDSYRVGRIATSVGTVGTPNRLHERLATGLDPLFPPLGAFGAVAVDKLRRGEYPGGSSTGRCSGPGGAFR